MEKDFSIAVYCVNSIKLFAGGKIVIKMTFTPHQFDGFLIKLTESVMEAHSNSKSRFSPKTVHKPVDNFVHSGPRQALAGPLKFVYFLTKIAGDVSYRMAQSDGAAATLPRRRQTSKTTC